MATDQALAVVPSPTVFPQEDQQNNGTIVETNTNQEAAPEADEEEEDTVQGILAMRKNLTVAFDKHAPEVPQEPPLSSTAAGTKQKPPVHPVAPQEKRKVSTSSASSHTSATSKRTVTTVPKGRPPTANVRPKQLSGVKRASSSSTASLESKASRASSIESISSTGSRQHNNGNSRFLTVYLRIRPPTTGESTIEIIADGKKPRNVPPQAGSAEETQESKVTRVRAHPPVNSQAYKALRHCAGGDGTPGFTSGVKEYKFNRVFGPTSSQEDVYNEVAAPLIHDMFPPPNCFNCSDKRDSIKSNSSAKSNGSISGEHQPQSSLIFTYGVTNAGKTYTIMGKKASLNDEDSRGLLPRTLSDIFEEAQRRVGDEDSTGQYRLYMSFFEIYNEQIFDLLGSTTAAAKSQQHARAQRRTLKLREDRSGHIFVQGLMKHSVESAKHGMELALTAKSRRMTSSNNVNGESSRSHSICQLQVVHECNQCTARESTNSHETIQGSTIWIVDLAGSERAKRTDLMHQSKRAREAVQINASLMNLMRCMHQLHNNQQPNAMKNNGGKGVVPFRGSKLSHLFMNHLTGRSAGRTAMVVNVNPAASDFDETQHVLSYAAVVRNVKITRKEPVKRVATAAASARLKSESPVVNGKQSNAEKQKRGTSPPKKVAKISGVLSPRACAAKQNEKNKLDTKDAGNKKVVSTKLGKRKEVSSKSTDMRRVPKPTQTELLRKARKLEKDNLSLSKMLEEKDAETSRLREESIMLKEELVRQESQIRIEVAEEWEDHIAEMQKRYEDTARQKQTMPTPGRTAQKIKMAKAEQEIDELYDKIDECEDEINRMREKHRLEMEKVTQTHEIKERELKGLIELHKKASLEKDSEIQILKEQNCKLRGKGENEDETRHAEEHLHESPNVGDDDPESSEYVEASSPCEVDSSENSDEETAEDNRLSIAENSEQRSIHELDEVSDEIYQDEDLDKENDENVKPASVRTSNLGASLNSNLSDKENIPSSEKKPRLSMNNYGSDDEESGPFMPLKQLSDNVPREAGLSTGKARFSDANSSPDLHMRLRSRLRKNN